LSRNAFQPTAKQRHRVSVVAGAGWTHEEIAICLGISRNTLEKYFVHELSIGAYERHAEVIEAMHATAKNGNAAAQKNYAAMSVRVSAPPVPVEPPKLPEGKKAKAQSDALIAHAGTDWENLLSTTTPQ